MISLVGVFFLCFPNGGPAFSFDFALVNSSFGSVVTATGDSSSVVSSSLWVLHSAFTWPLRLHLKEQSFLCSTKSMILDSPRFITWGISLRVSISFYIDIFNILQLQFLSSVLVAWKTFILSTVMGATNQAASTSRGIFEILTLDVLLPISNWRMDTHSVFGVS